jgi:hypothetical protein
MKRSGVRRHKAAKTSQRIKKSVRRGKKPLPRDLKPKLNTQVIPFRTSQGQPKPELPQLEPEFASVQELQRLIVGMQRDKPRKEKLRLDEFEAEAVAALLKAHGEDYPRWSRDVKRNEMQWTAQQCARKHRYFKQRQVD